MRVFKAHAQGNDYLVNIMDGEFISDSGLKSLAQAICHRHFGIGSDGIVFLYQSVSQESGEWQARIFNPDGGEAEVSGNGLRCAATCLCHQYPGLDGRWIFRTKSGVRILQLLDRKGNRYIFQADMGIPLFTLPTVSDNSFSSLSQIHNRSLTIEEHVFQIYPVSIGNPHCVLFLDGELPADWEIWSKRISENRLFPDRTNVEWVRLESNEKLITYFWERGVGATLASGSGSCAAAVVSIARGATEERVVVENRAGKMIVEWHPPDGTILLTGESEMIMEGHYYI